MPRTPVERVQDAQEVLDDMRELVASAHEHATDERKLRGILRRFLNEGRTVTWTLQLLKSEMTSDEEWSSWWTDATRELTTDPLGNFFYKLRNPAVKEGRVDMASELVVPHMRLKWITLAKAPDAPPPDAPPVEVTAYMDRAPRMTPGCETVSYPVLELGIALRFELVGTPEPYVRASIPRLMEHHVGLLRVVVDRCRVRFAGADAAPPQPGPGAAPS